MTECIVYAVVLLIGILIIRLNIMYGWDKRKHCPLGIITPVIKTPRPNPPPPMPPFTYTKPSWEKPRYTIETVEGSLTIWHPRQVSACIFPTDYENCQNRMIDGKCTSFVCTKIVRFRKDQP